MVSRAAAAPHTAQVPERPSSAPAAARPSNRLVAIDALRVALIVLVVAHHAGQAYGPGGGGQAGGLWPVSDPAKAAILSSFFSVNAAFFMGLFFLIGALFMPASYDRKGPAVFLADRFVRLGLPLVVVLLIGELAASASGSSSLVGLLALFSIGRGYPGHLWFLEHLLLYAVLYTAWRLATARWRLPSLPVPNNAAIVASVLALAAVTFVVRIEYPINRWVYVFGVLSAEVGHLPQYASLVVVGLLAARGRWFERLPTRRGLGWLGVGLAAALARYLLPIGTPGGANVGSLIWSTCEAFIASGLCLGLPVLFRDSVTSGGRWLGRAAAATYGVYLVHLFVVLALQLALLGLVAPALLKFALVTVVAVLVSFGLAAGLRRLPGVRRVL